MATEKQIAQLREVLGRYVPAVALDQLTDYIVTRGVHLRITRSRYSKFGDYRNPTPDKPYHSISVNGDLTHEFFLSVLLHEMAHLETYLVYKHKVQPHGIEWQTNYRQLLISYRHCMPADVLTLYDHYTARLPLSPSIGHNLDKVLREYGRPKDDTNELGMQKLTLNDLQVGNQFSLLKNGRTVFEAIERKRSRWVCRDIFNGKLYSVHGDAQVVKLSE